MSTHSNTRRGPKKPRSTQPSQQPKSQNLMDFGSAPPPKPEPPLTTTETLSNVTGTSSGLLCHSECMTCCDPLVYNVIGECNHALMCLTCALRYRTIFKNIECPMCKKAQETVYITKQALPFAEVSQMKGVKLPKGDIVILDLEAIDIIQPLLAIQCSTCKAEFKELRDLEKHVKSAHKLAFCDLCLSHRKVFLSEQILYPQNKLQAHMTTGDASIHLKPHPVCEYCNASYFSEEELIRHCEESHFKCFVCERIHNRLFNYFKDYNHLNTHFMNSHYCCEEPSCKEKKYVVFDTELELQAHKISVHTKSDKSSRVLNLQFQYKREPTKTMDGSNLPTLSTSQGVTNFYSSNQRPSNRPIETPIFYPDSKRGQQKYKQLQEENVVHNGNHNQNQPKEKTKAIKEQPLPLNFDPTTAFSGLPEKERSRNLAAQIKAYLGTDKAFERFKERSASYREGTLAAKGYYEGFMNQFGRTPEGFTLLVEMVALLQDEALKKPLIELYTNEIKLRQGYQTTQSEPEEYPSLGSEKQGLSLSASPWSGSSNTTSSVTEDYPSLPARTTPLPKPQPKKSQPKQSNSYVVQTQKGKKGKQVLVSFG